MKDLILLVEQSSFCEDDLIKFRLDWLFSIVVRYLDHILSGEAILSLLRQAAVLLIVDSDDVALFFLKQHSLDWVKAKQKKSWVQVSFGWKNTTRCFCFDGRFFGC